MKKKMTKRIRTVDELPQLIDDAKQEIGMTVDEVMRAASRADDATVAAVEASDLVLKAVKEYAKQIGRDPARVAEQEPADQPQAQDSQQQQAPSGSKTTPKPPATKTPFMRGITKLLNKASQAREVVFGSKVATETEKEIRKQYTRVVQQAILTQELLKDNNTLLAEKAKEDKQLAAVMQEAQTNKELQAIFEKASKGQELYGRELTQATEFMERITHALEESGVSLEINLPKAMESMEKFVKDTNMDLATRREAFEDIQKALKTLKIKGDKVEELIKIDSDRLNFTEEESKKTNEILAAVREEMAKSGVKDAKLTGTIRDLNKAMGSVVLTNKELNEYLDSEVEGKSMKDHLDNGLGAMGGGIKRGLFDTAGAALGLPGLGGVLEDISDVLPILSGLKKFGGKGLGKMGGLLGKIPGMGRMGGAIGGMMSTVPSMASGNVLGAGAEAAAGIGGSLLTKGGGLLAKVGGMGGLLKGGGRLLGKAALPLALAMGAWDFKKGYSNAGEISGKGDKAGVADKIQAGVSSVLEGLSFGLVSAQDAFKFIDTSMETVSGIFTDLKDGVVSMAKKLAKMFDFDAIKKGLMDGIDKLFGEEGFLNKTKAIIDKVLEFMEYTPIGLLIKGAKMAGDVAANYIGADNHALVGAGGPTVRSNIIPQAAPVDDRAFSQSARADAETRGYAQQSAENSGKQQTVVVQTPAPTPPRGPSRSTQVDDLGLAVLNSGMMDK